MKRDYAFVEFSDPLDADDARYSLDGRDVDGRRITVEFAKGIPRGPGGVREYVGRGPAPGSGRCFNCGIDGHWLMIAKLATGKISVIDVENEATLKGTARTALRS